MQLLTLCGSNYPILNIFHGQKWFLSWRSSNVKVSGRHNYFAKSPFRMLKDKIKYSLRLHMRAWTILWLNCLAC